MSLNFSDFIYCAENTLSEHFCQMCIDKFEAMKIHKGLIGSGVYEPEFLKILLISIFQVYLTGNMKTVSLLSH